MDQFCIILTINTRVCVCSGRLENVTVLIGLTVKGVAIGGVVNQPFYNYKETEAGKQPGRCVWGLVGIGR